MMQKRVLDQKEINLIKFLIVGEIMDIKEIDYSLGGDFGKLMQKIYPWTKYSTISLLLRDIRTLVKDNKIAFHKLFPEPEMKFRMISHWMSL